MKQKAYRTGPGGPVSIVGSDEQPSGLWSLGTLSVGVAEVEGCISLGTGSDEPEGEGGMPLGPGVEGGISISLGTGSVGVGCFGPVDCASGCVGPVDGGEGFKSVDGASGNAGSVPAGGAGSYIGAEGSLLLYLGGGLRPGSEPGRENVPCFLFFAGPEDNEKPHAKQGKLEVEVPIKSCPCF